VNGIDDLPQGIEQGPIRPPSEAGSLLLRISRNCPWNRCEFCHNYRGTRFSLRPASQLFAEIRLITQMVDAVRGFSQKMGKQGRIDEEMIRWIASQEEPDEELLKVALWLFQGGTSIFLQDANSLVAPIEDLVAILDNLKDSFPSVERITTYARSQTLARMQPGWLERLRIAGLSRIHVGLETGDEELLKIMKKGTTSRQHIEGGLAVKNAGLELSEYVILGLAGVELSSRHAIATAAVLNRINPDFIRFRTLAMPPMAPLTERWRRGEFQRMTDEQIVREEKLLLENLTHVSSNIVSDHITNLLPSVNGSLPRDRLMLLRIITPSWNCPKERNTCFRSSGDSIAFTHLESRWKRISELMLNGFFSRKSSHPADRSMSFCGRSPIDSSNLSW
jgi:hypothetical protein